MAAQRWRVIMLSLCAACWAHLMHFLAVPEGSSSDA